MAKRQKTRMEPPSADPAEAIERLISRRQLKIQPGDIVVTRIQAVSTTRRESFLLEIAGDGGPGETFATFEHAAVRGEFLAQEHTCRLFFRESRQALPSLLMDCGKR